MPRKIRDERIADRARREAEAAVADAANTDVDMTTGEDASNDQNILLLTEAAANLSNVALSVVAIHDKMQEKMKAQAEIINEQELKIKELEEDVQILAENYDETSQAVRALKEQVQILLKIMSQPSSDHLKK
ncbi:hypothetical protein BR93DRAFT_982101 [Coniochaeta sp. PMI_546]|nr:hypothetical protein BR93DRAFT_982101 [Coniochaeta sp. PMI_546]